MKWTDLPAANTDAIEGDAGRIAADGAALDLPDADWLAFFESWFAELR